MHPFISHIESARSRVAAVNTISLLSKVYTSEAEHFSKKSTTDVEAIQHAQHIISNTLPALRPIYSVFISVTFIIKKNYLLQWLQQYGVFLERFGSCTIFALIFIPPFILYTTKFFDTHSTTISSKIDMLFVSRIVPRHFSYLHISFYVLNNFVCVFILILYYHTFHYTIL